jgi:hypothetical protein
VEKAAARSFSLAAAQPRAAGYPYSGRPQAAAAATRRRQKAAAAACHAITNTPLNRRDRWDIKASDQIRVKDCQIRKFVLFLPPK